MNGEFMRRAVLVGIGLLLGLLAAPLYYQTVSAQVESDLPPIFAEGNKVLRMNDTDHGFVIVEVHGDWMKAKLTAQSNTDFWVNATTGSVWREISPTR